MLTDPRTQLVYGLRRNFHHLILDGLGDTAQPIYIAHERRSAIFREALQSDLIVVNYYFACSLLLSLLALALPPSFPISSSLAARSTSSTSSNSSNISPSSSELPSFRMSAVQLFSSSALFPAGDQRVDRVRGTRNGVMVRHFHNCITV